MRESGFTGSADQVVDRIGALRELGYTRIYFQVMDLADLDQLDFLAREVIPRVGA